jgi:hypothetical protein
MGIERSGAFYGKSGLTQETRKLALAESILEKWQRRMPSFVHRQQTFEPAQRPEIWHSYEYAPARLEDAIRFYQKGFWPFLAMFYYAD